MLDHYHRKFHILLHNFECHDITEIQLRLVLNTKEIVNQNNSYLIETMVSIDKRLIT
jgi:predicted metal-dependent hydrolase